MPGQAYRQYKGELNSLLRRFLFQIQLELREQTRESQSDEKSLSKLGKSTLLIAKYLGLQ